MFYINTKFFERLRQASRWFVLLLLACLADGVAQAQTLSFTPGMVTALTSTDSTTGSSDPKYTGPLSGLIVNQPQALTYDSQGNLFIVDAGANVVRVVASGKGPIPSLPSVPSPKAGTVYTVAGSGSNTPSSNPLCTVDQQSAIDDSYYGNGCPASAAILYFLQVDDDNGTPYTAGQQFTAPLGQVALDANGNLYIADAGDYQVRVVYAAGTVPGLLDKLPTGVTAPVAGNIYALAGDPTYINQNPYGNNTNPDGSLNLAPDGVAVDASGDVYIVLYQHRTHRHKESDLAVVYNGGTLPPILAGQTLTTGQYVHNLLPLNYQSGGVAPWQDPASIALDSSGNIYIGDSSDTSGQWPAAEYVIYAGGTVPGLSETLTQQGLFSPVVGNAYAFAGTGSATPAYATTVLASNANLGNLGQGLRGALLNPVTPTQLAIDSAGNFYTGIYTGGATIMNFPWPGFVAKIEPSGNLALFAGNTNTASTGLQAFCAAAVDAFGDGCPANQVTILGPLGVAAAPDGSIEYADDYIDPNTGQFISSALHKIDGSASAEQFPTATAGVASVAQVVSISNVSGSTEPLNISAINFPNNFTQVASSGTDCSASTTLTAGQSCLVGIQFQAVQDGSFTGDVTITSNSSNAASGVNSIAVSGTATATTGSSTQSINFTAPSTATYGQNITLNGVATSGLPVLYQVTSGPGIINGSTLTVTGVGAIIVTAYQPGDNGDVNNSAGWQAATPVQATITGQPALLTVKANDISQARTLPIPSLTSDYTITVTINGVTSPAPASATTGAPTLSTTASESSPAGTYPITIAQNTLTTASPNYSLTAASFVNGTFTILPGSPQTITFTRTLPTVTYGVTPIDLTGTATASTGLPVVYTATGPATTSGANGTTLTITGAGTVTVIANQVGDATYAEAPPVTQSFQVNPATLTLIADNLSMAQGSPVPALTYRVGGLVNSDTSDSVVSGTPTLATAATSSSALGTYPITVAQGSVTLLSKNYALTSASYVSGTMSVVIGQPQTISFGALPNVTYGTAPIILSATASSGLPVTFSVSGGPASITGNNVLSVTGAGTVTVTANQSGKGIYSPAPAAKQSFTVAQAALSIVANSMTIVNNISIPPLTFTVTGLVNGDTSAVLSGTPVMSTTATAGSSPGTYPINIASLDQFGNPITATSYTINAFVPGTVTITSGGPAQDFTPTLSTPTLTILDGQVGQATITVNRLNYYSGALNLSCTGLPANVLCVFSPSPLNVPIKLTATLTISTSSATVVGSLSPAGSSIYRAAIAGWMSLLVGLVLAWQRKRLAQFKTIWVIAMAVCLFGTAASLSACGGKSSSSSTSKGLAAPGTSTIQVVATDSNGGPSHTIPLVITIR